MAIQTRLKTVPALVAAILLCGATASAQDAEPAPPPENELQQENARLLGQIRDLERELLQAQQRIRELEALLQRRGVEPRRISGTGGTAAVDEGIVTVDESVPNASPRALFKAIVSSYDKATEGQQLGEAGDRTRRNHLRKLEAWRVAVNRDFRSPINWHVRVIDARVGPDQQRIVTFIAVDPKTEVQLGNSFDIALSSVLVERLANFEARGDLGLLVMRGTLHPEVRINAEREDRGTFDHPPFIGPFAEFMFRIDATSIKLVKDDVEDIASGKPAPGTNMGSPPPRSEK